MRIGHRRGLGLAVALLGGLASDASAGSFITDIAPWIHTIPRVTYARDLRTGEFYYAPPVPYGHYAKDHGAQIVGAAHGAVGHLHGAAAHLKDKAHHVAGAVHGLGDHLHNGGGIGHGHGHGGGLGHGGTGGLLDGSLHGVGHTLDGHGHGGLGHGMPHGTPQFDPTAAAGVGGHHGGLGSGHGGLFGGLGHGLGLGHGGLGHGDGLGHGGLGHGDGLGHSGLGGHGGLHDKLGHLKGLGHGALGYLHGLHPSTKVRYFTGAGGPVPLTPGYVPYINVTRSPRDFFAFPPYSTRALD